MRQLILIFCILTSTLLFSKNIVVIGDSHGALSQGWVHHLSEINKDYSIFNLSISGNTIGFHNNGQDTLNTLHNIESYVERAKSRFTRIDVVIILLGTNDCKAVFASRTNEVENNLNSLLLKINQYFMCKKTPEFIYVSPPPMADDVFLAEKYIGGNGRLKKLLKVIKQQTKANHFEYIDIFHPLWKLRNTLTADGVHYKPEGYKMIAEIIQKKIK